MTPISIVRGLSTIWLLSFALALQVQGEVFVLKSGGRITGEWVNRDESPREKFVIRTVDGTQVTLDRRQVEQILHQTEAEQEYQRIRPTFPDTAEGHLRLARWCGKHQLPTAQRSHFARVLELDPENADARTGMGYRLVAGRWMTRDEEMGAKGLILYDGRYRTKQEIDIWEREKKDKSAERDWHGKIKLWRGWLDKGPKASQAHENFLAIRDPAAVKAIARYLKEESVPPVRMMYLEILAQIASPDAIKVLVAYSLNSSDDEVRLTCLDHLKKIDSPNALPLYTRELKNKNNLIVNRAGRALGILGKKSSIGPLIDALVTEHKFIVQTGSPSGQTSAAFNPSGGGGGGMSFGSSPPKVIKRGVPNKRVLDALVSITGKNFEYDVKTWKYWYASQKKTESSDLRRD